MVERFTVAVRVQPGARDEGLADDGAGAWQARVKAPATEDRANDALVALLARALGVRRSAVSIVRGRRARRKLVQVVGMGQAEGERRLRAASRRET